MVYYSESFIISNLVFKVMLATSFFSIATPYLELFSYI